MDTVALEGYGVFISSLIVFCGSVWLLLAVVLGSRLAYFITASVTLGFVLIMSVVWSFTQLGPLGELPSWSGVAAGASGAEIDFPAAGSYPEGEWTPPGEDDEEAITHATEAEGAATEFLAEAIESEEVTTYENANEAVATPDSTRLFEDGDNLYAATLFQPAPDDEGGAEIQPAGPGDEGTVLVVVEYHPGNPYGLARNILIGVIIVFALHMFGLSRAERRAIKVEAPA